MSYIVELQAEYENCPQWWQQLCSHFHHIESDEETDDAIRSFITSNGGIIKLDENDDCIEYIQFPSEAHFNWFLLKL